MKRLSSLLFAAALLFAATAASAGTVTGAITDRENGKPLQGANVLIDGTSFGTTSDAQGAFSFAGLPDGKKVVISASYIGYRVAKTRISLSDKNTIVRLALTPILLKSEDVVYTASRARADETPASFTDVPGKQIRQQYWAQDLPPMLEALPGVYSYSEVGTGIGYTYMTVRGFDQKRLGITVNGIPLNDPEDGTVYWVDTPDLAANLQDAQLQRGVSYSASGSVGR